MLEATRGQGWESLLPCRWEVAEKSRPASEDAGEWAGTDMSLLTGHQMPGSVSWAGDTDMSQTKEVSILTMLTAWRTA